MNHGLTIFSTSLFLYLWYPPDPRRRAADWLKLGLAAAFVALVRWQEGVIIFVPLAEIAYWHVRERVSPAQSLTRLFALGGGALIGFVPQFVVWSRLYESAMTIPQGEGFFAWSTPHFVGVLFSTRHGLFSWHPIFLLALLGLPLLWRRSRALAAAALFLFLAELYVNASVAAWWADDAFGGRRFTGLVPLFVPPLACLIDAARREWQRRAIVAALAVLIVWNGLSFVQYRAGFVHKGNALTLREMTIDRLLVPIEVVRRIAKGRA
jgi:hypothetical protein